MICLAFSAVPVRMHMIKSKCFQQHGTACAAIRERSCWMRPTKQLPAALVMIGCCPMEQACARFHPVVVAL